MDKEEGTDMLIVRRWAFDILDALVCIDIRGVPETTLLVSSTSTFSIRVDDVSSRRLLARAPGSLVTTIGDSEGKDVIGGKGAAIQPTDIGLEEVGLAEGMSISGLSSSSVSQDGAVVG